MACGLGLALRLLGITWGLPGGAWPDEPPIHPDEHVAYEAAVALYGDGTPGAMTFIYGGALYPRIAAGVRALSAGSDGDPRETFRRTLLGLRLVDTAAGLATGALVFWIASAVGGASLGLASLALFLVLPSHVLACHYARPDVVMTLLATLSLACAVRVARGGSARWLLAGAVAAGAAMATLLSGAIALLPLVVGRIEQVSANAGRWPRAGEGLRAIAVVAGGGALGYALGSVESGLHREAFLAGLSRAASTHGGAPPFALLGVAAAYGFGSAATLAGYAGLVLFALRPRPGLPTIVSYALAGVALLFRVGGDMMRHTLFLAPVMAIAAMAFTAWAAERIAGRRPERAALAASALLVLLTLPLSLGYVLPLQLSVDPRYRAGEWLRLHTPADARIGATLSYYGDRTYQPRLAEAGGRRLVPLMVRHDFDASRYLARRLDYVVTSDFARDRARGTTAPAFFEALFRGDRYRQAAEIAPEWIPFTLPEALGLRPPGDLLYVRPTFHVLERIR